MGFTTQLQCVLGKHKSYTVKGKLIIERIKKGKSKGKIRKELGITEATISRWMGKETRLVICG